VAAGGHPSDADREAGARPVLEAVLAASTSRDRAALAASYAEDVVWLDADGAVRGRDAAADRHAAIAAEASGWGPLQQKGAHAVLRWSGEGGARGAIVVEVRRERIIFAATA
jgi:ketosteroid isomerase-like protein